MPSLIRFLVVLGLLAGLIFAAMEALAMFVEMTPRPMEQAIPSGRLNH